MSPRAIGLLAVLCATGALTVLPSAAAAQPPVATPPIVVDGPSDAILGLGGVAVARDGSGGLVYLKRVGGIPHVFVSRLAAGVFQPPEEVDSSLGGTSSQPVIAAANGGLLVIAFINGGELYAVDRTSQSAPYSAPIPLASGASSPDLSMTLLGKAYLAFTAADGLGTDVRSAYYYEGQWGLEPSPLNVTAADDAGTGAGAPKVAAASDGVAIVAWGEEGQIYSRRVWGTSPSVVYEQADTALPGCTELSAGDPVIATGGDSSYADVGFDETLSCSGIVQSRVLMRVLQASQYDAVNQPDGVAYPGSSGADQPGVTTGEYGRGWVISARSDSNELFAMQLGTDGVPEGGADRVDSLVNDGPPDATVAMAGLYSDLIAWQQDPGAAGEPEIRVRYAPLGLTLGPELVVSSPFLGPTDAADGLTAGGDIDGDAVVAWVQGDPTSREIVTAQLYQAPGSFGPRTIHAYSRSTEPTLTWSTPQEAWGPLRYTVSVDGVAVGQTEATSLRIPTALPDGPHTWTVQAANPAGLTSVSRAAQVFVDTTPPTVQLDVYGSRRPGSLLRAYITCRDLPPPPEPATDASGVAKVTINWGDGTTAGIHLGWHRSYHAYKRAGRYKVTVKAVDKAGNTATEVVLVRITPPPRPHKAKPHRRGHKHGTRS